MAISSAVRATRLERPKSLTELVKEHVRTRITNGELMLGEALSENVLAAQLGISKTPVREALLQLKLEGLVDIQPQRGSFVFTMAPEEAAELCQYRSEEHTSELQSLMRISYAVFCLKKTNRKKKT